VRGRSDGEETTETSVESHCGGESEYLLFYSFAKSAMKSIPNKICCINAFKVASHWVFLTFLLSSASSCSSLRQFIDFF
jgi:hypothetical protein